MKLNLIYLALLTVIILASFTSVTRADEAKTPASSVSAPESVSRELPPSTYLDGPVPPANGDQPVVTEPDPTPDDSDTDSLPSTDMETTMASTFAAPTCPQVVHYSMDDLVNSMNSLEPGQGDSDHHSMDEIAGSGL